MLLGREAERTAIAGLLDAARASRSSALVLRGEPGAGKSALLEDARERAADMRVLAVRGVESESELPFAGLHQLLRPALHLLGRLPGPQAGALEAALGLADRGGHERFLVSAACLTLLAEQAEQRPVLCLVDDAQWLDTPSADALLFVARRIDAEGIAMLFAARDGFASGGLPERELAGLERDAATAVLAAAAGTSLAGSVAEVLVEQARGNPLALVELPSGLTAAQLSGAEPLPPALPLSRDLERLFVDRVRALPEPAQRLLVVIAADHAGLLAPVMRAADALGIAAGALDAAEHAGLVSVSGERIALRHPLVRSAVLQSASSSERRRAHLALADALSGERDSDQRAWHRAASALGPDAGIADELERSAERARQRGGHAAAAAALARAAELSADDGAVARRLVAAAGAAWRAGRPARATALLDGADPLAVDPHLRAELDHVRGVVEWRCGSLPDASATLLGGAAEVAALDPDKALELLCDAALAAWDAGDFDRLADAGGRAAALPPGEHVGHEFIAEVLAAAGSWTPLPLEQITRVRDSSDTRLLIWAAVGAAVAGEHAIESELMRRAAALARSSGAVDTLMLVLEGIAVQGVLAGDFGVAPEAGEGLGLAREAGLPNAAALHLSVLACLAAVKGDERACRAYAAEAHELALANGASLAYSITEWALALLDLAGGRPDQAVARLVALRASDPVPGHPLYVLASAPDLVEAAVRAGSEEEAHAACAALEESAGPSAPAWTRALAARCRAQLAPDDVAEREFAGALALHGDGGRPFDRARTQLLLGEHLRRRRRRVEARTQLNAALDSFEALGALPWAERARSELRASGETLRKRDPDTLAQLTPQELHVARFVAEGLSNKQVAAQLFLSPRTIDAHLRSVFAKLGVSSRTQLARLQLTDQVARPATFQPT